jgi:hypothetical protein
MSYAAPKIFLHRNEPAKFARAGKGFGAAEAFDFRDLGAAGSAVGRIHFSCFANR